MMKVALEGVLVSRELLNSSNERVSFEFGLIMSLTFVFQVILQSFLSFLILQQLALKVIYDLGCLLLALLRHLIQQLISIDRATAYTGYGLE